MGKSARAATSQVYGEGWAIRGAGEVQTDTPVKAKPAVDLRDYLAEERTFLAWVRTGIALMGFGFVVARFGLFLLRPCRKLVGRGSSGRLADSRVTAESLQPIVFRERPPDGICFLE